MRSIFIENDFFLHCRGKIINFGYSQRMYFASVDIILQTEKQTARETHTIEFPSVRGLSTIPSASYLWLCFLNTSIVMQHNRCCLRTLTFMRHNLRSLADANKIHSLAIENNMMNSSSDFNCIALYCRMSIFERWRSYETVAWFVLFHMCYSVSWLQSLDFNLKHFC